MSQPNQADKPPQNQQRPTQPQKLSPEEQVKAYFTSLGQSEDQQNRSQVLRKGFENLALLVLRNTQPSADQTAAIRKLRESCMTLIQGISLEEVGK